MKQSIFFLKYGQRREMSITRQEATSTRLPEMTQYYFNGRMATTYKSGYALFLGVNEEVGYSTGTASKVTTGTINAPWAYPY